MTKKTLVPTSLCNRCGACFAADTEKLLTKTEEGFPILDPKATKPAVERLLSVCTGTNWNYRELLDYVHGQAYKYDPAEISKGALIKLGVAHSANPYLIEAGQSGGVSTSIIAAALHTKLIEAFLAVRRPIASKGNPFTSEPFIVKNLKDLTDAAGSKYTVCSSLELIPELEETTKSYAVSLLPCQTAGLAQLQRLGFAGREKCKLIIGPFCGYTMEAKSGNELAQALDVNPAAVSKFGNRTGSFPGITSFTSSDGSVRTLDRTAHRALYRMYTPERCFTCTDFTNELADLSIADYWGRDENGGYSYPKGAAWILVRTERGLRFLKNAIDAGFLVFHETALDANDDHWRESIRYRKVRAFNRVHIHHKAKRLVPDFDHGIPEFDEDYSKADYTEYRLRSLFQIAPFRKFFLKWWVSIHSEDASPQQINARAYLGTRLFTHHSQMDSLPKAFLKVIGIYLRQNQAVLIIKRIVRKIRIR